MSIQTRMLTFVIVNLYQSTIHRLTEVGIRIYKERRASLALIYFQNNHIFII